MSFLDSIIKSISGSAKSTVNSTINNAVSSAKSGVRKAVINASNDATKALKKAIETKSKSFTFAAIPTTMDEFKALSGTDMKDPFAVTALTIIALNMFYKDNQLGREAFDYVMGPGAISNLEAERIRMSISQNGDYVATSYFEGTKPENNYTPTMPLTIKVYEYSVSKDILDQGYYRLFVKSSGADTERQITLRQKKSTEQWFAHEFSTTYMGIRVPVKDDAWA